MLCEKLAPSSILFKTNKTVKAPKVNDFLV